MAYAAGKYALFISDRSGAAFPYKRMRIEWTGARVDASEYEPKSAQLEIPKNISDPEALQHASSDRTEPLAEVLLRYDPFRSGNSGSSTITVRSPGHGRSTGDTVRFRSVSDFDGFTAGTIELAAGYSVTKVDSDFYTFAVDSETATTGDVLGGGGVASAGPVTVSA
jgi:hypothetical protein